MHSRYVVHTAGIPACSDSLFRAVVHQLQLLHLDISFPPDEVLGYYRDLVSSLLAVSYPLLSRSIRLGHTDGGLRSVKALVVHFDYSFKIYAADGTLQIFPSTGSESPCIQLQQRFHYFDSVYGATILSHGQFKFGSWNLRGALNQNVRLLIDNLALSHGLDLVAVQETHLSSQSIETPNYSWLLGPQSSGRASRGCGYMIRKTFRFRTSMLVHSPNILSLQLFLPNFRPLTIINVHRFTNGDPAAPIEAGVLLAVCSQLSDWRNVLLCGDFNAHLGITDCSLLPGGLVGPFLHHTTTNDNGDALLYLAQLYDLRIHTTRHHGSTIITRSSGGSQSQIDHVMSSSCSQFKISHLRGQWTRHSDHKLITMHLQLYSGIIPLY